MPVHTDPAERGAHLRTVSKSAVEETVRVGHGDIEVTTHRIVEPAPEPPAAPETPAAAVPVVADPEPRQIQELEAAIAKSADEREKADREISELRSRLAAPAAPAPPATVAPPAAEPPVAEEPVGPKPTRADFFDADDPDEAFADALIDWKDKEKEVKRRHADNERKAREEAEKNSKAAQEEARKRKELDDGKKASDQKITAAYEESLKAARQRHADWDRVLATPGELCSPAMAYVAKIEANAELFYWLGKHPEEAARICAATKLPKDASEADVERAKWAARREFDAITAGLRAVPRSAAPQVQSARAAERPVIKKHTPVAPVDSRGGRSQKTLTQMSQAELRSLPQSDYRKMRGN